MSTEHQQYSTENQGDKIGEYASRRNLEIVQTYAGEGKSGLRIDGREALQRLIRDVESGNVDFQIILVYDVSRWGRFQDADESAYYEYICRRAGIQVANCAEQFEKDGSPVSTIVKGVKRAMAGSTAGGCLPRSSLGRALPCSEFRGARLTCDARQGGLAQHFLVVRRPRCTRPELLACNSMDRSKSCTTSLVGGTLCEASDGRSQPLTMSVVAST